MKVIDITSEIYSDVTYTRTVTARQLPALASELVAVKFEGDREYYRVESVRESRNAVTNRLGSLEIAFDGGDTYHVHPNTKFTAALVG